MDNPQAISARIISEVISQKKSLSIINKNNNNLVQEICFGVFRWFPKLEAIANLFIKNKIKKQDFDIYILILIGFYQINFLRIPNHAAVFETAKAADQLNKSWAKSFINGVLRNYLRNEKKIEEKISSIPSALYSHPDWLLKKFQTDWPDHWLDIVRENNNRPPMILRINSLKISRNNYLKKLEKENIKTVENDFLSGILDGAIILYSPCDVKKLPGYLEGEISVQDGAAQLAAELLLLLPGQRILDACAAPGGKTTHILEKRLILSELIAVDNKPNRLNKIKENLMRLGLNAKLILADAACPEAWWDSNMFDRILLDAPCSATGVIRRHPDIKIIRQPEDISEKTNQQLELLNALWPLLKPGGILLYASCSIFPEENAQLLESFLQKTSDAREEIIHADWGIPQPVGRQILPCYEMDGFFYARLKKC